MQGDALLNTLFANSSDTPTDHRQHCTWCCDEGVIFVGTERRAGSALGNVDHYDEEMWAPCPMCELGHKKDAARVWRGRSMQGLVKQCRCDEPVPSREEMRAVFEKAKSVARSMFAEPDPDAPRIRINPGQRLKPGGGGGDRLALPERSGGGRATEAAGTSGPAVEASPGAGATPGANHHRCPGYDGKDMPWSKDQCEACDNEEITL